MIPNGGSEWQNDFSNLPDYYNTFFRNYDPALGRFVSLDPDAESAVDMTGYQYAANNPVLFNDPLGDQADGEAEKISRDAWQKALDDLLASPYGGTSSSGKANPFSSAQEAFDWGVNYMNSNNLWGQHGYTSSVTNAAYIYNNVLTGPGADKVQIKGYLLNTVVINEKVDHGVFGTYNRRAFGGDNPYMFTNAQFDEFAKQMGYLVASEVGGIYLARGIGWLGGKVAARIANSTRTGNILFKSFTKGNFRFNLGQLTGRIPKNSQAHHVFANKFADAFESIGINIHDPKFGAWWDTTSHLKNAAAYNKSWEGFLRTNPTLDETMAFGRELMQQYGVPISF